MSTPTISDDLMEAKGYLDQIQQTSADPATAENLRKVAESLSNAVNKMVESQTTPQTLLHKLTSRKFWLAMLGAIASICGLLNSGGDIAVIGIFVLLMGVSILGYFITEGNLDTARVQELLQTATQLATVIGTLSPTSVDSSSNDDVSDENIIDEPTENSTTSDIPETIN